MKLIISLIINTIQKILKLFLKEYLKIKMTKLDILYEGKAKILYETSISNELIQFFKDDATAHNAQKLEIIIQKDRSWPCRGVSMKNNQISSQPPH